MPGWKMLGKRRGRRLPVLEGPIYTKSSIATISEGRGHISQIPKKNKGKHQVAHVTSELLGA